MLMCSCTPETKLEECLGSKSELQAMIEAQQKQTEELTTLIGDQQTTIDDLTKQYSLDYSRLVMLGREAKSQDDPSANVTVTYPDAPRCEGGYTRWRVVLTETNGVGVTFTHGVFYCRVLEEGKWSQPLNVGYYDNTTNWLAWPICLPPNWQEDFSHGDVGCFSEQRRYTSVYCGEDDNGHDIVAMGTIAINEHS